MNYEQNIDGNEVKTYVSPIDGSDIDIHKSSYLGRKSTMRDQNKPVINSSVLSSDYANIQRSLANSVKLTMTR